MENFDETLKAADPARGLDTTTLTPVARAMWERAQERSNSGVRRPRRARRRILLPVGIAVAIATTGAAAATPFFLGLGEERTSVQPDAQIPIVYETLSGELVECTYSLYVGPAERSGSVVRVADALASTIWDGIGQEIYDYAMANPREPRAGETWEDRSQRARDIMSFQLAIVPIVERRLPADLQGVAEQWRSTDTCSGPFR